MVHKVRTEHKRELKAGSLGAAEYMESYYGAGSGKKTKLGRHKAAAKHQNESKTAAGLPDDGGRESGRGRY